MVKYWVGVASKEHVELGMAGNFCQLCHGKGVPLNRMKEGDWLIYYAPKISLKTQEPYQKFMAVGQIRAGEAYLFQMAPDFIPYRKEIAYLPIKQTLPLSAVSQFPLWKEHRSKLRFGHFEIPEQLFDFIVFGMMGKQPGKLKQNRPF